ncbi:MAG: hypothetical protein ACQCXQ_11170, partial [Verrucomicrobiales bacterium]
HGRVLLVWVRGGGFLPANDWIGNFGGFPVSSAAMEATRARMDVRMDGRVAAGACVAVGELETGAGVAI